MDIDNTDFLILKCLHDAESPLWKNKIYDEQPGLFDTTISVQTVGRRVDKLRDAELLNSCIISPDDIKRDLIISFELTENGKEVLAEKRKQLLMDAVQKEIFLEDNTPEIETETLIELIRGEFDLDDDARSLLREEYTRKELLTFLTMYYVRDEVKNIFTAENVEKFAALAEQNDEISSVLHESVEETVTGVD